jgi:hypothetical protein
MRGMGTIEGRFSVFRLAVCYTKWDSYVNHCAVHTSTPCLPTSCFVNQPIPVISIINKALICYITKKTSCGHLTL